jgi:hypothetical protein
LPFSLSQIRTTIAKAILPSGGRVYPQYKPTPGALIGSEIGRSGLRRWYPGWIRDERLSDLMGRKKYLVYEEMGDMNAYCAATLNAFAMFLRRAQWRVDPVSDDNKTNGAAEFLQSCMDDMEHSFQTFMAVASRMVPQYGFSPHEIIYKLREGPKEDYRFASKHDDGLIGWQNLAIRSPDTILHWVWYPDDPNRLRGLIQLTPPDYPPNNFIPIEKLLLLRAEPGKDNPEGRSVLRSSYKPFVTIKVMEDFRNIIVERGGAGIPYADVPPTISDPYQYDTETGELILDDGGKPIVDPRSLATLNSIIATLKSLRQGTEPYIIRPQQYDEKSNKMFDIGFLTNNGGSMIQDINTTIHEEGMKILMGTMTEFLALGTNATGGGSFALAKDKTDNFTLAITAYLDSFQESINNQAVARLFALNESHFGRLKELPRIVHEPIIPININEVMAVFGGFKGLGWDLTKVANWEDIQNAVLDAVGLPKAAIRKQGEGEKPAEVKPPAEEKEKEEAIEQS